MVTFDKCNACHGQLGVNGSHVNQLTNIKFNYAFVPAINIDDPTFDGLVTTGATGASRAPGSPTGSCANLYCHSVGNLADSSGSGAVVPVGSPLVGFKSAPWDVTSLDCADCHGDGKRMDWKALGYAGDPIKTGGRK